MSSVSNDIEKAVLHLSNDEVVAIPTETVYGLAGNAFSEKAVKTIFEVKQRPFFNPLIVHTHAVELVETFVSHFPQKARALAERFWPGSLTLVLNKKDIIPGIITAGKNTVAVRIPDHPVTLELLKRLPFPLAAPSANPFGSISPTKSKHVEEYFSDVIPMVLEGGSCKNGLESTIIGFENNEPLVYRLGAISLEDIESVIGKVNVKNSSASSPAAPGMLLRHYAPSTPTILVENLNNELSHIKNKRIGVVSFFSDFSNSENITSVVLSKTKNLKEAGANLYNALHQLDQLNLDLIIAEKLPDEGLGKSINDRLFRATQKH
ncbi:MAG: L-threonylcarbamoyladenylate synthase [Lishizhenia sp.]